MRYAVVTDAHGDLPGLRSALKQISEYGADEVISLGDLVDCRISSASPEPGTRATSVLSDVVDWDDGLAELVADLVLIRGNQEERIVAHLPAGALPESAHRIMFAQPSTERELATFCHGHLLPWVSPRPDLWCPLPAEFATPVLVYGHHHRNAVFELPDGERHWDRTTELEVRSGVPVRLAQDRRYLVNVGPARGSVPSWALIDEASRSVTLTFARHRYGADHA